MAELSNYIIEFHENTESITPIIIDEVGAQKILQNITKVDLANLSEYAVDTNLGITIYSIPEDRKLFDIATVLKFIKDVSLIPYEKRHVYILQDIDTASPEAMNALLKTLEECPKYAAIILVVTDPNSLILTIHSRCINYFELRSSEPISSELTNSLRAFAQGNPISFIQYLHKEKIEKESALSILRAYLPYADRETLKKIEWAIIQIRSWFDNPKNLLETVFLCG